MIGEGGLSTRTNSVDRLNLFILLTWKIGWIHHAGGRSNWFTTGEMTSIMLHGPIHRLLSFYGRYKSIHKFFVDRRTSFPLQHVFYYCDLSAYSFIRIWAIVIFTFALSRAVFIYSTIPCTATTWLVPCIPKNVDGTMGCSLPLR